jgi:hypothetical protein
MRWKFSILLGWALLATLGWTLDLRPLAPVWGNVAEWVAASTALLALVFAAQAVRAANRQVVAANAQAKAASDQTELALAQVRSAESQLEQVIREQSERREQEVWAQARLVWVRWIDRQLQVENASDKPLHDAFVMVLLGPCPIWQEGLYGPFLPGKATIPSDGINEYRRRADALADELGFRHVSQLINCFLVFQDSARRTWILRTKDNRLAKCASDPHTQGVELKTAYECARQLVAAAGDATDVWDELQEKVTRHITWQLDGLSRSRE